MCACVWHVIVVLVVVTGGGGEGLKVLRVKRNRLGKWLPSWYGPRTKGGGHLRTADEEEGGRRILLFLFRTRPTSPSHRTPPPPPPPPLLERDKTLGVLLCSAMISIAHPHPAYVYVYYSTCDALGSR